MLGLKRTSAHFFSIVIALLTAFIVPCGLAGAQAPTDSKAAAENQSLPHLKLESNLVVLRVVIRDAQGQPVDGLKKEDFKLSDQGKEQSITQFEAEPSLAEASSLAPTPSTGQASTQAASSSPSRFLALYFDNMHSSDADLILARETAERYLSTSLQPQDRVAIFSTEKMLSDFTSDPGQIHDALLQLRRGLRALNLDHDCPDLTDYQAQQMIQWDLDKNNDAWVAALAEETQCPDYFPNTPPESIQNKLRSRAQDILSKIEIGARFNSEELDQVVRYISQLPGQRTVIMVSPGFLSVSEQSRVDRIINDALRSQVIVNSLDPRGLANTMRESDTTERYMPTGIEVGALHRLNSEREQAAVDVLAELAQATGGQFFHNSNNLLAGLGSLAGHPGYYILAFSPKYMKQDGKFHALKVTMAQKQKGYNIQARRGYFASTTQARAAEETRQPAPSEADAQQQEQIREAIRSKTDSAQFPVELVVKTSSDQGPTRELSLLSHMDAKSLHLRKDGEHNLNTVTFAIAVFDLKDSLVQVRGRARKVSALDEQLPALFNAGFDISISFQLKPGSYRVREVVIDSEEHRMTAFSRNVTVP